MDKTVKRRRVLAAAASAWLAPLCQANARRTIATLTAGDGPSLVVAGPAASEAAEWTRSLLPALSSARGTDDLTGMGAMRVRYWGGHDGVTGLNQFEARIFPGGQDALVFPGSALMAWLVGDPRVAFDTGRLLPLLARVSPGVLMLRGRLRARQSPVRLAMAPGSGPALAGFLGLDLLQVDAEPVAAPGVEAAMQHSVDAVFLHGADVPARSKALSEAGLTPLFTVGSLTAQGVACRDPAFSEVPTLPELLAGSTAGRPPTAWSAVASASVLDLALALPALSTGAGVARWRHTVAAAAAADRSQESSRGLRLLNDTQAAAAFTRVQIDTQGQMELRRWVATRLPVRG